MPDMPPTSLAKSLKMASFFLKEEKICYKIVYFTFKLSQSSEIVFQSQNLHRRKTDFSERALALKGLILN